MYPAPNGPLQSFAESLSTGLEQLKNHCAQVYPSHPQPVPCLKPERSFILEGGADPLDYIYVYKNAGHPEERIPRHWHYIGLGLSDIHGYSFFCRHHELLREKNPEFAKSTPRMDDIYPPPIGPKLLSGFGFELTMRVKCNSEAEWQADPPCWPGGIMQDLARYVFRTRNVFNVGDHVAWHSPLDSTDDGAGSSRIEHVLMTLDPQLGEVSTRMGSVKFIQIVGVCNEELEAAREWNVRGVLEMMREREQTGGPFLVTDMRRGETIFEIDPDKHNQLEDKIRCMGSDMAQISVRHKTSHTLPSWFTRAERGQQAMVDSSLNEAEEVRADEGRRLLRPSDACEGQAGQPIACVDEDRPSRPASRMSLGSESGLCIENIDLSDTRYYNSVYLLLSYESARVLPVMLNGRLAHQQPFSFQSLRGDSLVTFIPEGYKLKSLVEPPGKSYAKQGHWLQIYVPNELRKQMTESIIPDFSRRDAGRSQRFEEAEMEQEDSARQPCLPRNYSWPEFNLHLTIVAEITDDF